MIPLAYLDDWRGEIFTLVALHRRVVLQKMNRQSGDYRFKSSVFNNDPYLAKWPT